MYTHILYTYIYTNVGEHRTSEVPKGAEERCERREAALW